jgi:hypothetical protein
MIALVAKCYLGDHLREDLMGRACCMYGSEKQCKQGFDGES